MRIILPIAAKSEYTTGLFLEKAFKEMGHDAVAIDQGEFYEKSPDDADLFMGVDSGGGLNVPEEFLPKFGMWYIDSRRNSNSELRDPNDDETALRTLDGGGLVFQAQREDKFRLERYTKGIHTRHIYWLPLAADPEIWDERPIPDKREHRLAFVGNCYDTERLGILGRLEEMGILFWPGIEKAIWEDGATVYRHANIGLNVPSWLGTPECYDVNMRVFEIMSCGVPLITNHVADLEHLYIDDATHFMPYPTPTSRTHEGSTVDDVVNDIVAAVEWLEKRPESRERMGRYGRRLILERHTYVHRARSILHRFETELGIV